MTTSLVNSARDVLKGKEPNSLNSFSFISLSKILEGDSGVPRVPPASKEVVAKLPVTTVSDEILVKLGKDAVCSICQENLIVDDKMQELPCKHMFHPPCLKPWLVNFLTLSLARQDSFQTWFEQIMIICKLL